MTSELIHSRTNARIRPWGVRPTPLVPAALRAALSSKQAPATLCALAGKPLTFRDLGANFWQHVNNVDKASLRSLVNLVQSKTRRFKRVRLNFSVGNQRIAIDALPLSNRTRNALRRHFGERRLPKQSAVGKLLMIKSFGVRCLLELACVIEAAQLCEPSKNATATPSQRPKPPLPSDVGSFFQLLGAWAAGEQKLEDLSSALPKAPTEWPEELQYLWTLVGRADARMLAGDTIDRYSVPALVSSWINGLDERLTYILEARVLATDRPATLEELGEHHGMTRERARQIEKQSIKRLERFQSAEYRPVLRRAIKLRERLGIVLPENDVGLVESLNWVVADINPHVPRTLGQHLFLWLAGPYRNRNGWLVADSDIVNKSKTALVSHENDRALIPEADARVALNEMGIRESHHGAWIDQLKIFHRVEEGLLHFSGNILDKAEQFLRYCDRPMTADELVQVIGSSSARSVQQRMMDDPRFRRINKQNQFVLAENDGYDEYTGITDEIIQELEACGGSATVEHLVRKITRTYGVQPSSVIAYVNTPLFVRNESGLVRQREDEKVVIATNISKTACCYRLNGKWAWRAKVDQQLLRGSGSILPNAFARELGCDLGDKIEVGSAFGNITISWPTGSTTGATLGTIRYVLKGLGAADGDYVFIIANDRQIEFQLLRQEKLERESAAVKLAHLVGVVDPKESNQLLPQIAGAFDVDQQENAPLEQQIRDVLLSRGEDELGDLIKPPKLSMDQYLKRIGSVLEDGN